MKKKEARVAAKKKAPVKKAAEKTAPKAKKASKKAAPKPVSKAKSKKAAKPTVKKAAPKISAKPAKKVSKAKTSLKNAAKKMLSVAKKTASTAKPTVMKMEKKPEKKPASLQNFLTPLDDRLLVRLSGAEKMTAGGLYIPDTVSDVSGNLRGQVVSVGRGHRDDKGRVRPMDVTLGDQVIFAEFSGSKIKIQNEDLIILREAEVMGIVSK